MEILDELQRRITQGANAPNLAFLLLLLSLFFAPMIAGFVRLPSIVGLVVIGLMIGPHGFGILASNEIALSALGDIGLLYAVFVAGLELDVRQLVRHARTAILFALASFAIPFALGLTAARLFGYTAAAAALMGSSWGSHTMVSIPVLRKLGLARNRAVATVVGATPVTSILVVGTLVGVSVVARRGTVFADAAEVVLGLVVLVGWSVVVLPRLGRWFFARVGSDTGQRFVFTLGAFFFGAILAEAAGVHGIVGAFLAGLGLSRTIPARSPLMERVVFVGGALFIPIFLVWVGTLLDPAVLLDPSTLSCALVFAVIVLGSKLLAAILVGRHAAYTKHEIGIMAGLSSSQVATTLATIAVGARLGLLDPFAIHVTLTVILATLVVAPVVVTACGRKLTAVTGEHELAPPGQTIVVPIWGESSRPLLALAGQLAEQDMGMVVASSFAVETDNAATTARQRMLCTEAEQWLAGEGLEGRSVFRISRSVWAGLLQTVRGEAATMIVSEWQPVARDALRDAPVPVVLARGAVEPFERIVVVVSRPEDRVPRDLELAREVTARLARGRPVRVVASPMHDAITRLFTRVPRAEQISSVDPLGWVESHAGPQDLVVLPGLDELDAVLARAPELARRFVLTVAVKPTR